MFKVLVAEDEPKSRGALISRLRGILGDAALIEAASDGNDAVDKALRVQPDIIFMDIEMPGKNGLEAAAVIKKQIQTVHIIFLTAYDRFDYAVGAIRSGGEDYILKPVGEVELRESLQKFLCRRHLPLSRSWLYGCSAIMQRIWHWKTQPQAWE